MTPPAPADGGAAHRLSVVVPMFNERDNAPLLVADVCDALADCPWPWELIVVDDGSTDGTRDLLTQGPALDPRVRVVLHGRNQGKGAALRTGFREARGRFVLVQDADLEYDPSDYPALVAAASAPGTDAVFGNRWERAPRDTGYRRLHAAANGLLTRASNLATGLGVRDMECCYKLLPVPLLRRVRPWLSEERFGIEPQIAAALARLGARVAEVPVGYAPRSFSQGKKIRWTDGVRAIWVIARERVRRSPAGVRP